MMDLVFIHTITVWFLVGLIMTIHFVHYPSFHYVDRNQFSDFCRFHQFRITWIVVPTMILELLTGVFIVIQPSGLEATLSYVNLAGLLTIWLITFIESGPLHIKLLKGYDKRLVDRLIKGNLLRTLLWLARGCLLLYSIKLG